MAGNAWRRGRERALEESNAFGAAVLDNLEIAAGAAFDDEVVAQQAASGAGNRFCASSWRAGRRCNIFHPETYLLMHAHSGMLILVSTARVKTLVQGYGGY